MSQHKKDALVEAYFKRESRDGIIIICGTGRDKDEAWELFTKVKKEMKIE